jgi:hypothetical protein
MNEQMKLAQMDILIMQMPVQQMRNVPQLVAPGIAMESPQPRCINRRALHPQTGFTVPTGYSNRRRGLGMESPPGRPEKKLYGRRLNCLKPGYCFGNAERRHGVKRDAREPGTKPGLLAQNANARSGGHLQEYFKVLTLTQPQRLLHELQESCASSYLQYLI